MNFVAMLSNFLLWSAILRKKEKNHAYRLLSLFVFVRLTSISCGGGLIEKVFVLRRREVVRLRVCVRCVIKIGLRFATVSQRNLDQLSSHQPAHVSSVPLDVQIRVDLYLRLHLLHRVIIVAGKLLLLFCLSGRRGEGLCTCGVLLVTAARRGLLLHH